MNKHLKNLSASTFQMVVNQVFGLLFFLGMAALLPKPLFGQVNWAVAICTTLTIVGSLGFDHIIVKKLSSGARVADTSAIHIGHTFLILSICLAGLGLHYAFDPGFYSRNPTFAAIFVGILATFLSIPYKQLANGKERFWHLAFMGISGNVFKVITLISFYLAHRIDEWSVSMVFLIGGLLEWGLSIALSRHMVGLFLRASLKLDTYRALIREALPQMGVILLDSAFARIDWILMGFLSTDILTADYSFSYKAYESSRLPMLIIAPLILPKISRRYSQGGISSESASGLNLLWRAESLICIFIPLVLNVVWVDLIDLLTKGRYGHSTQWVYAILSLTLPMAYMINYLWTLAFAQGRLKMIFQFTAITLACNLIFNFALIPSYGALGAAIAFTASTAIQLILYKTQVKEPALQMPLTDFLLSLAFAILLLLALHFLAIPLILRLAIAILAYCLFIWTRGAQHWLKFFRR
jgi:O-antigen/teichoic acid export membrane protein